MTADIINLRNARKAKARAKNDARAAENRVRFGRTKAEREQSAAIANPDADDDLDPGNVS